MNGLRRMDMTRFIKMHSKPPPPTAGFTLVELMVVVVTIGLLAAIAIPNLVQARTISQSNVCINNLKQLDSAISTWALETGKTTGTALQSTDLQPYLGRGIAGALPWCPNDATKTCNRSYTVGNTGKFIVGLVPVCFIMPETHVLPYASN